MAKVQRFEELEAWQTARAAVELVYEASSNGKFSRDFALRDQIRRAAVSMMSNITKAKKILDWEPRVSRLEGLKQTVPYFQASLKSSGVGF